MVSNEAGSVTSSAALLTVNPSGVSIGIYPGITIDGVAGRTYGIQYATNLDSPAWINLTNLTLTVPTQLWFDSEADVSSGSQPRRFYRVIAVP